MENQIEFYPVANHSAIIIANQSSYRPLKKILAEYKQSWMVDDPIFDGRNVLFHASLRLSDPDPLFDFRDIFVCHSIHYNLCSTLLELDEEGNRPPFVNDDGTFDQSQLPSCGEITHEIITNDKEGKYFKYALWLKDDSEGTIIRSLNKEGTLSFIQAYITTANVDAIGQNLTRRIYTEMSKEEPDIELVNQLLERLREKWADRIIILKIDNIKVI